MMALHGIIAHRSEEMLKPLIKQWLTAHHALIEMTRVSNSFGDDISHAVRQPITQHIVVADEQWATPLSTNHNIYATGKLALARRRH